MSDFGSNPSFVGGLSSEKGLLCVFYAQALARSPSIGELADHQSDWDTLMAPLREPLVTGSRSSLRARVKAPPGSITDAQTSGARRT